MPILTDSQHEAFAQARFTGRTLMEAFSDARFTGVKASAAKLAQRFDIKERIAELFRDAASRSVYDKASGVKDLLGIIHACPSEAAEDNPLCERRLGKNGDYYRFPSKLAAMSRLIKLMG